MAPTDLHLQQCIVFLVQEYRDNSQEAVSHKNEGAIQTTLDCLKEDEGVGASHSQAHLCLHSVWM